MVHYLGFRGVLLFNKKYLILFKLFINMIKQKGWLIWGNVLGPIIVFYLTPYKTSNKEFIIENQGIKNCLRKLHKN